MDVNSRRQLGNSSLHIRPFGFGGGTIGNQQISNHDSEQTVAAAFNNGAELFDTAPLYGLGRSERRLGLALHETGERDKYRINTKIGKTLEPEANHDASQHTLSPGGEVRTPRDPQTGFRVHFDYSYDAILLQHQDSLQRLGHSAVDSLTIHDIDYGYHSEVLIEKHLNQLSSDNGGGATALHELRDSGQIKAIGCGCNLEHRNAWSWEDGRHEDLMDQLIDLVDLDFIVVAGGYTLLETQALRRILPTCEERGIGVIIAAPFASGWLVSPDPSATYMYGEAPPDIVARSQAMYHVAAQFNFPLAAAAIQFPLHHPSVAAVIPGAKSAAEVEQNRVLLDTTIPEAFWDRMKELDLLSTDAPV